MTNRVKPLDADLRRLFRVFALIDDGKMRDALAFIVLLNFIIHDHRFDPACFEEFSGVSSGVMAFLADTSLDSGGDCAHCVSLFSQNWAFRIIF